MFGQTWRGCLGPPCVFVGVWMWLDWFIYIYELFICYYVRFVIDTIIEVNVLLNSGGDNIMDKEVKIWFEPIPYKHLNDVEPKPVMEVKRCSYCDEEGLLDICVKCRDALRKDYKNGMPLWELEAKYNIDTEMLNKIIRR